MTTHPRIAELAALDIDFDLSLGDRAELEEHLASCGECRALARAYRTDADALRGEAFAHAPSRVRSAVMLAATRPVARSSFSLVLVAAALVAAALVGLLLVAGAANNEDRKLVRATSVPTAQATQPATIVATVSSTPATPTPSRPARSLTPTIPGAPVNDNPPGIAITSLPFAQSTDTTRAQIHAMEGASVCGSGGQSVWYSYTADQSTTLAADTFGSDYNTILDIWTGTLTTDYLNPGFETLVPLACNDNAGFSPQSEVVFNVTAGVSYVIRVSTALNATGGALTFHLGPA